METKYIKVPVSERLPTYDEMIDMLEEFRLQLEYLNKPDRGTTKNVLSILDTLLNSIKQ